jgi:hypothetical protein
MLGEAGGLGTALVVACSDTGDSSGGDGIAFFKETSSE